MIKFCFPSFEYEKKTYGLNIYLWSIVSLIMILLNTILIAVYYCTMSIFNILEIIPFANILIIIDVVYILLSIILGVKFLNCLPCCYKWDGKDLIKGIIKDTDNVTNLDMAINTASVITMSKNINDHNKFNLSYNIRNYHYFFRKIMLNTNQEFVEKYFDTDLYKKKIYKNVQFVKEKKYSIVYESENKKIIIPKIYVGLFDAPEKFSKSLLYRVSMRIIIVFILSLILLSTYLMINFSLQDDYKNNIKKAILPIQEALNNYDYKLYNNDNYFTNKEVSQYVIFEKNYNNRKSKIKYNFKFNGQIDYLEMEMYFENQLDVDACNYVLSSLNVYSNQEIENFTKEIENCMNNNCSYAKLEKGNYKFRIGRSNGIIEVHSY